VFANPTNHPRKFIAKVCLLFYKFSSALLVEDYDQVRPVGLENFLQEKVLNFSEKSHFTPRICISIKKVFISSRGPFDVGHWDCALFLLLIRH